MMHEVNITAARNLSLLFDKAVREGRPVMIVRNKRERGLLLSREQQLRLLESHHLHVNVLPEEEVGGFTLWVAELGIGAYGQTLHEASAKLLDIIRSYVRHYVEQWDFYRHIPDLAVQEPYVYRLSLATDDAEPIGMLFKSADAAATRAGALASSRLMPRPR